MRRCAQRTVAVMQRLVELCALMGGSYLVHGSPKQRSRAAGRHAASRRWRARASAWRGARATARAGCGVIYCIEPLSPRETDLLNTVAEAAQLVRRASARRPCKTMIDCSAAGQAEAEAGRTR